MHKRIYPVDYRAEILTELMSDLQHGQSLGIVGLAGVGKSNLVTFMAQERTLRHYLPESLARRTQILTFQLPTAPMPEDVYVAMLGAAMARTLDLGVPYVMSEAEQALPVLVRLRRCLQWLCEKHGQRVVFVFDEFEALLRGLPSSFLDDLRSLRDEHRTTGNLVYVTITHILPTLIPKVPPIRESKFFELIRERLYPLRPYTRRDAESMIDDLIRRHPELSDQDVPAELRDTIWDLSGGHAGLIRALFDLSLEHELSLSSSLAQQEIGRPASAIHRTLEKVWEKLHRDEQAMIRDWLENRPLEAHAMDYLRRRGILLRGDDHRLRLFSPLFEAYVRMIRNP